MKRRLGEVVDWLTLLDSTQIQGLQFPSEPSESLLLFAVLLIALVTALVAAAVSHGVLQPLLEARGISPWRVRDTLAATPLILLGSAVAGTSGALVAGVAAGVPILGRPPELIALMGIGIGIIAVIMLLLGLLAIRKLV